MKRSSFPIANIAVLSLMVVLLGGCGNATETATEPTQTQTPAATQEIAFSAYTNDTYGISINYPKDWTMTDIYEGTVALFLSPKESSNDRFQENVNVAVEDLSAQPLTLNEYTALVREQVKDIATNVTILEVTQTTLSGQPAHKMIYTGTFETEQGNFDLKWMQVWTVRDNKAYINTFTADQSNFDTYEPIATQMINSFEIKK